MLTLEQAIALATKAHEGQWRTSTLYKSNLNLEQVQDQYPTDKFEKTFIADVYNRNKPYINHPLTVMSMMDTDEEKIVAVLHDVVEDNKTFELKCDIEDNWYINTPDSKSILISTCIGKALASLSNSLHLKYEEYITDVTLNKLATKVKLADIVCNLADTPSEHAKQKYLKALPILLRGL